MTSWLVTFKTKSENNYLKYGLCTMEGYRDSMEDAHCLLVLNNCLNKLYYT